jgi:hypothetical protein
MMPPIMASISRKSLNKVPIIIFGCYLLGDEPIIIEHFLWVQGVFMGLIMGVTLVVILCIIEKV